MMDMAAQVEAAGMAARVLCQIVQVMMIKVAEVAPDLYILKKLQALYQLVIYYLLNII